jgi:hypothetical protein
LGEAIGYTLLVLVAYHLCLSLISFLPAIYRNPQTLSFLWAMKHLWIEASKKKNSMTMTTFVIFSLISFAGVGHVLYECFFNSQLEIGTIFLLVILQLMYSFFLPKVRPLQRSYYLSEKLKLLRLEVLIGVIVATVTLVISIERNSYFLFSALLLIISFIACLERLARDRRVTRGQVGINNVQYFANFNYSAILGVVFISHFFNDSLLVLKVFILLLFIYLYLIVKGFFARIISQFMACPIKNYLERSLVLSGICLFLALL